MLHTNKIVKVYTPMQVMSLMTLPPGASQANPNKINYLYRITPRDVMSLF